MASNDKDNRTGGGPHKARSAANSLVMAAAVIGSLILLNLISIRVFGRADLTEDHIFTLSKASKDTVKNLPDRMNAKLFVSGDLPPPLNQTGRYVGDLLDEYKTASAGKFNWERVDPTEGKDADEKGKKKEELNKYKIQKLVLQQVSAGKMEVSSENYLGIAFVYGDQIEAISQVTNTEGLEFEITGMIRKLVAQKKKKIGFATSEGELSPEQGLQILSKGGLGDYDIAAVTLDKPIGDDFDALMIVGPKQPFTEKGKFYLDQFLMKGKPVAMFIDGLKIESPKGMNIPGMEQPKIGQPNDVNLQDMLEKYGVKVREDLILDQQDFPGAVPIGGQLRLKNYPTFIAITEKALSKESDVTKRLGGLIMPFASSLELTGDVKDGKGSVKAIALASSSTKSWRNAGFFLFNPEVPLREPESAADRGPFVLGYALQGEFKTAFPNGAPGSDPNISAPENANLVKQSPAGTRLLVMGCSGMLDDHQLLIRYVPQYQVDLQFGANVVDWMIHEDALMALRQKGMGQRPFVLPSEGRPQFWRWMVEAGVPLLLVIFGVILMLLRDARRRSTTLANL